MDSNDLKDMFNKMYEGFLSQESRQHMIEWMDENAELIHLELAPEPEAPELRVAA